MSRKLVCATLPFVLSFLPWATAQEELPTPAPAEPSLVATLNRSASGKKLDEKGFSSETITLQKGMTYPVEKQELNSVTLRDGELLIKVNKSDVELREDDGTLLEGSPLKLISAIYWDTGGSARYSVESELRRLLPKGRVKEPKQILIGHYLLGARASEVTTQHGTVDSNLNIRLQAPKKMALDVVWEYEGRQIEKTIREGEFLTIP
jgi:hypothetical protein